MTSSLRTFGKSLHWLAAGWLVGVVWLCYAQMRRGLLFDPVVNYHLDTLIEGAAPALIIETFAFFSLALMGAAPTRTIGKREWVYAFVWSLFPNLMILYTVYMMVTGDL
jgi:hypothetical protein